MPAFSVPGLGSRPSGNVATKSQGSLSRQQSPLLRILTFSVVTSAAAEMTRELLPSIRAAGSGHILNLTSIGGLVSVGGFGPYCASKFALEGWSEALRDEVKAFGIRVTIVEPGAFRTKSAGDENMRPEQQLEAYRPVIEPIEKFFTETTASSRGIRTKQLSR